MKNTYLNDYHRQRSKRLEEHVSQQPKVSLEDAMKQYDRIKRGSMRQKSAPPTAEPVTSR
ncbi:MAG TPA: hypothetical protein VFC44_14595 [Candidatus Saccharimonadales bacterium]|nr:hypothetical protein [Candidatus Saccharimonadales bacterium]